MNGMKEFDVVVIRVVKQLNEEVIAGMRLLKPAAWANRDASNASAFGRRIL